MIGEKHFRRKEGRKEEVRNDDQVWWGFSSRILQGGDPFEGSRVLIPPRRLEWRLPRTV